MAGISQYGWKWLEIVENGWKWLECSAMAVNSCTWLEMVRTDWKWLKQYQELQKLAVNDWKGLEMTGDK